MSKSAEFREYADECMGWAKTAKSDRERETFLQMAKTWLEAAVRLEAAERHNRPEPNDLENRSDAIR